jgi:hypothetical protein
MGVKGAIRFNEKDDRILLDNWWDSKRRKEIAAQLARTVGSCNDRYYRLLREQNIDPAFHAAQKRISIHDENLNTKKETVRHTKVDKRKNKTQDGKKNEEISSQKSGMAQMVKNDQVVVFGDDIYKRMDNLENMIKENRDGEKRFMNWLQSALYLYKSGILVDDVEKIIRENARLKAQNAEMQEKLNVAADEFSKSIAEMQKYREDMEFVFGAFQRMPSGEKYSKLGDFLPDMKMVIDKFGIVIGKAEEKEKLGV